MSDATPDFATMSDADLSADLDADLNDAPATDAADEPQEQPATPDPKDAPPDAAQDPAKGNEEAPKEKERQEKLVPLAELQRQRERARAAEEEAARLRQAEADRQARQAAEREQADVDAEFARLLDEEGPEAAADFARRVAAHREQQARQRADEATRQARASADEAVKRDRLRMSADLARETHGEKFDAAYEALCKAYEVTDAAGNVVAHGWEEVERRAALHANPAKWVMEQAARTPGSSAFDAAVEKAVTERMASLSAKHQPPPKGGQGIAHLPTTTGESRPKTYREMSDDELDAEERDYERSW